MARYISRNSKLKLLRNDGTTAYEFINGVLNLGSGVEIDADAKPDMGDQLVYKFPTDLQGDTAIAIEMAGMGSLTGIDANGNSFTPADLGLRGLFFNAEVLTSYLAESYLEDTWYVVLSGEVEYPEGSGNVYYPGEKFSYILGQGTKVGGGGTFSLALPAVGCDEFLDEQFKIKHLRHGGEPKAYYVKSRPTGYVPRDGHENAEETTWGIGYIHGVVTPSTD